MIVRIYNTEGELCDELRPADPDNVCWGHRYGGGLCGGCDLCLLMQAEHANHTYEAGLRIEYVDENPTTN